MYGLFEIILVEVYVCMRFNFQNELRDTKLSRLVSFILWAFTAICLHEKLEPYGERSFLHQPAYRISASLFSL